MVTSVKIGDVFRDIQLHSGRLATHLRGRRLIVRRIEGEHAICRNIQTGQTNTKLHILSLLDETRFVKEATLNIGDGGWVADEDGALGYIEDD